MPEPDYRIRYKFSNDYWLYGQYCKWASEGDNIGLIGDCVIWGQYVKPEQVLAHYLSGFSNRRRVLNFGVEGIHPVAMAGLPGNYGEAISEMDVNVRTLKGLIFYPSMIGLQGFAGFILSLVSPAFVRPES